MSFVFLASYSHGSSFLTAATHYKCGSPAHTIQLPILLLLVTSVMKFWVVMKIPTKYPCLSFSHWTLKVLPREIFYDYGNLSGEVMSTLFFPLVAIAHIDFVTLYMCVDRGKPYLQAQMT